MESLIKIVYDIPIMILIEFRDTLWEVILLLHTKGLVVNGETLACGNFIRVTKTTIYA